MSFKVYKFSVYPHPCAARQHGAYEALAKFYTSSYPNGVHLLKRLVNLHDWPWSVEETEGEIWDWVEFEVDPEAEKVYVYES